MTEMESSMRFREFTGYLGTSSALKTLRERCPERPVDALAEVSEKIHAAMTPPPADEEPFRVRYREAPCRSADPSRSLTLSLTIAGSESSSSSVVESEGGSRMCALSSRLRGASLPCLRQYPTRIHPPNSARAPINTMEGSRKIHENRSLVSIVISLFFASLPSLAHSHTLAISLHHGCHITTTTTTSTLHHSCLLLCCARSDSLRFVRL